MITPLATAPETYAVLSVVVQVLAGVFLVVLGGAICLTHYELIALLAEEFGLVRPKSPSQKKKPPSWKEIALQERAARREVEGRLDALFAWGREEVERRQ